MSNSISPSPTTTNAAATTAASATTTTPPQNILGKDDFLKIFLAQLSQQDPTQPVDSTAFVAQLAQFSTLELQQNANQDLESLMVGQAAAQQTGVTSLVGKQVEFNTNSVSLTVGQPTLLNSSLAADASSVTAVITDSTGKTVRTLTLGGHAAGPMPIAWDGRDQTGNPLPTGTYTVNVTATDPKGASVGVSETASGLVSGVSFSGGTTQLLVGSSTVQLSNVTQVSQVTPNTPVTP